MEHYFSDHAIVLRAEPIGEYDRRLVLLTKDHGKVSAFARGARRQNNKLMAATDLFCFGEYKLYAGQNSYSLVDVTIKNYFAEFKTDITGAMYGMYFLEVMDHNTRENNDEELLLRLLYQALRALTKDAIPNSLIKAVFELKTMILMGEFRPDHMEKGLLEATAYTIDYVVNSPIDKLFTFTLKEEPLKELIAFAEKRKKSIWNHSFKSEEMLDIIAN